MNVNETTKKLLVIDGNALVHRVYHALPPLTNKKGELVNAVYGFLLVFLKALKELKPDFVAATFDLAAPTFRHKAFKDYKAKRPKAPDELYQQLPRVKEVLAAFNIPIYEKEGFEADDVIGTIAVQVPKKQVYPKIETIILSGDMDNLQLVNEQTKVYTMRKGIKDTVLYDIKKVEARYDGLKPCQLQDYRGLRGDASDNIPGVTGIGEKTAIQLLKDFGALENLYQEIEESTEKSKKIKPSVLQKLKDYKEQAFFSKELAKIHCDVPFDFNLKNCEFGRYESEKVREVFKKYEFYTLLQKLSEFADYKNDSDKPKVKIKAENKSTAQSALFEAVSPKKDIVQEIDELEKQGIFSKKIAEIEKQLAPVVKKMENQGIKVDLSELQKLSKNLEKEIEELQKNIYQSAGAEFNINSPQQLSEIIFSKLQISFQGLKKTPGGAISTGAEELKKLKGAHSIIDLIIKYREIFKLKSGFVDSLSQTINLKDSRIHPHFHQLGAETGRMSCSNPNLQNIPIKSESGQAIRKCFVAEPGFTFLSVDYSQVELRIAASVAKDEKMLAIFNQGEDIHILTASEIFDLPKEKIDKTTRDLAKTLNFGVLYGMGSLAFSERTGIEKKKAREFIRKYFEEFKGIAQYVDNAKRQAKEQGFAETLFGRKRFLPEINSIDPRLKAQAERMAINMPIQGSCADIIKMAMVEITQRKILNSDCRMLLQIHDELLFEVKENKIKEKAKAIKSIMENVICLAVPLKVTLETGQNWGELEKL